MGAPPPAVHFLFLNPPRARAAQKAAAADPLKSNMRARARRSQPTVGSLAVPQAITMRRFHRSQTALKPLSDRSQTDEAPVTTLISSLTPSLNLTLILTLTHPLARTALSSDEWCAGTSPVPSHDRDRLYVLRRVWVHQA